MASNHARPTAPDDQGEAQQHVRASSSTSPPMYMTSPTAQTTGANGSSRGATGSTLSPELPTQGFPARRQRSVHINIKPDPAPPASSFGVALPGWLQGNQASGSGGAHVGGSSLASGSGASSSLSRSGSAAAAGIAVPHRDFGMAPFRPDPSSPSLGASSSQLRHHRASTDSHIQAHTDALSRSRRESTRRSSSGARWSTRWAGLIRNQVHRIERDGLRRSIWSRGRQFGDPASGAGQAGAINTLWGRLRRIPEILWVESEDPSGEGSVWQAATAADQGDKSSDDTDDLLDDEDEKAGPRRRSQLAPRRQSRRAGRFARLNRLLDRGRRKLGISRPSFILLLFLLALGLFESLRSRSGSSRSVYAEPHHLTVNPSNPFKTLQEAGILLPSRAASTAERDIRLTSAAARKARTTAILLSWKRVDNLVVILAHLCAFAGEIFDSTILWNNNPDIRLTHEMLEAAQCPQGHLRIYNSPGNQLFFARFLACSLADTPYCYFQDDDWLVPSLPAVHAHFLRNPKGPAVVATGDEFPVKEGWEWCFFNPDYDLNTCFAWLGTGAFVDRSKVLNTLETITAASAPSPAVPNLGVIRSDELAMLDNTFTTFQNEPPYVISSRLIPLAQASGIAFTAGFEGDIRNELYIQRGIDRLSKALHIDASRSPYVPPLTVWQVDTSHFKRTANPWLLPILSHRTHPYGHHTRSAAYTNDFLFIANVANLPPPDSVVYQPHPARNLSQWEESLADDPQLWKDGKAWALDWPYYAAVDGNWRTAWRSPDVIAKDDYIGMDLLKQLDVGEQASITIHVVLEYAEQIVPGLTVETSLDGYAWQPIFPRTSLSCHVTGHLSTHPTPSFPNTYLTSSVAQGILNLEADALKNNRRSWSPSRSRLQSCEATLQTTAGGARRKGWRFVRLRSERPLPVGWGVYEMWVS